jgi:hypothetical protein
MRIKQLKKKMSIEKTKQKNVEHPLLYKQVKYTIPILDKIAKYNKHYNESKCCKVTLPKNKKVVPTPYIYYKKQQAIDLQNKHYPHSLMFQEEVPNKGYHKYIVMEFNHLVDKMRMTKFPQFHQMFYGYSRLVIDFDSKNKDLKANDVVKVLEYLVTQICIKIKKEFNISIDKKTIKWFDACRDKKISYHIHFNDPKLFFKPVEQAGIFLAKIFTEFIEEKKHKSLIYLFAQEYIDFNIYKEGHSLRLYYNTKRNEEKSRLYARGKKKKPFNVKDLQDSLICFIPPEMEKIMYVRMEDVDSLSESYYYQKYIRSIEILKNKDSIHSNRAKKARSYVHPKIKMLDLSSETIQFYEFFNQVLKKKDKNFNDGDFVLKRATVNDFGNSEFSLGPAYCLEVYGSYCPPCKRSHGNAKTKSYFYFPLADIIKKTQHIWIGGHQMEVIHEKKLSDTLYVRCMYRYQNDKRESLKIHLEDYPLLCKKFVSIHQKIVKQLSS